MQIAVIYNWTGHKWSAGSITAVTLLPIDVLQVGYSTYSDTNI